MSCGLRHCLIYAISIDPGSPITQKEGRRVASFPRFSCFKPSVKDQCRFVIKEDNAIRSLVGGLEPNLLLLSINIIHIQGYQFISSYAGLGQQCDYGLVPDLHSRIDEARHLLH